MTCLNLQHHFCLEGKRITQSLCHHSLDLDEKILDNITKQSAAWKSNLLLLEYIKGPKFLLEPWSSWKKDHTVEDIDINEPETKKKVFVNRIEIKK